MATTYTAVAAGGSWNNAATWGGGGYPVAGDTAVIDATMTGTVTVNIASACAVLNMTNNGGTLAFGTNLLVVSGLATLQGVMSASGGSMLQVGGGVTLLSTITGTFPTLKISASSTLTSNGYTWPGTLTNTGGPTYTLAGNWINTGLVTIGSTTAINYTTAETFTCNGGLTVSAVLSGTATIILGGTGGVWSGSSFVNNNMNINCTSLTVSGTVSFKTGTLTYTAGTITTTGSTLSVTGGPVTLNTNGISWNNITAASGSSQTITLGSDFTCTGTITSSSTSVLTFSGAYNITLGTIRMQSGAQVQYIIPAGQTLTVTNGLTLNGSDNGNYLIKSDTISSPIYLVYQGTKANCKVYGMVFTDVDASGGNPIWNYSGGTLTRTLNIIPVDASYLKKTGVWGAGAVASNTAQARSGTCAAFSPTSATDPFYNTFLFPTTASTAGTFTFYHRITSSFPGSMTVTIYDTDDTTKLINNDSVSFTDDGAYHQYSSGSITPTTTGFCRVVLKILGASGTIYFDDDNFA